MDIINTKTLNDELIYKIAKKYILDSIKGYCSQNRKYNFHPLDLIVPKLRNTRSVIGGIETSMGTKLWEGLAKRLAKENDFKVIDKELDKPMIEEKIENKIEAVIHHREEQDGKYDEHTSKSKIKFLRYYATIPCFHR